MVSPVCCWNGSDGEWEDPLTWHVAESAALTMLTPLQLHYCEQEKIKTKLSELDT